MNATHVVLTILLEADATYSWLLPDGTILPVSRYTNHNDVARSYYFDKVGEGIPGSGYQEWAKSQGWTRMVGTGFEAAKLTPRLLRRVQNAYIDAGVREMASAFFVDIGKQGQRDWQSFVVPYREFLDMGKPAELRRYRVESMTEQKDLPELPSGYIRGNLHAKEILSAAYASGLALAMIGDEESIGVLRELLPDLKLAAPAGAQATVEILKPDMASAFDRQPWSPAEARAMGLRRRGSPVKKMTPEAERLWPQIAEFYNLPDQDQQKVLHVAGAMARARGERLITDMTLSNATPFGADLGAEAQVQRARQTAQRRLGEVQAVGLRNVWEIEHDEVQKILFADPEQIEDDENLYEQYQTLVRDLFPEYVGSYMWEGEEHDPIQDLVHRAYNFGGAEDYTALADYLRGNSQKLADHHARIIGAYGDEFGFPAGIGVFKSVRHGFESRPMELGLHVLKKLEAGQEPDHKDFEAAQDPFEQAKERFGVTTNLDAAFYLLPDGDMLSGGGGTSSRAFDHRQIGYGKGGTEGMQEFMSLGAIRLMPEDGSVDIMVSPTSAQMRVLGDWIEHYNLVDGVSLDLQDGIGEYDERQEYYLKPGRTLSKVYEPDENPKRILGAIRRFFGGG